MIKQYLSIDLGASSGRLFVFESNGNHFSQHETYRFENKPVEINDRLSWDFHSIFAHILKGLEKTFEKYPDIRHVGIDSFAVDYGLLGKDGRLLRQPISYRDGKAKEVINEVEALFKDTSLYQRTGIQHLDFNTVYRLYYLKNHEPSLYEEVEKILLIPDLIAYYLTGQTRMELTNLSTTALLDAYSRTIDPIINRLGIDETLFPDRIHPSEPYGQFKNDIKRRLKLNHNVDVVAVCTHDTASAITAISNDKKPLYISSGTWSLVGTLLDQPKINEETDHENFTNEIGYDSQIRFLKNTMGFWLFDHAFQEYQQRNNDISLSSFLNKLSTDVIDCGLIDIDDDDFVFPDGYLKTVYDKLMSTGQEGFEDDRAILKTILISMAFKYRDVIQRLESLIKRNFKEIIVIGGGSKNNYLNQLIADVTDKNVMTGPKEATALGNALVLMQSDGMFEDLRIDFDWKNHFPPSLFQPEGKYVTEKKRAQLDRMKL